MGQISKEAVAGVWPVVLGEAQIARAFPSISATWLGKLLGRLYSLPFPIGFLIHLATLPIPVLLAVVMFVFGGFRRYTLSSTRVRIQRGAGDRSGPEVLLSELDEVRVVARPGQAFYRAADCELISRGNVALTLPGVQGAEPFAHIIMAARNAAVQVAACQNKEVALSAT